MSDQGSDIRAFMIGPKAENLSLFRQLICEALDDHMYWRRNFHPEDEPAITSAQQHSPAFQQFEDRLRLQLFRFLADAKKGIPFFSPRYIGHMNTDLLMPALVGYFAAMLYNQNNVAGESSPRTAELEQEVMVQLAEMVGLPTCELREPDGRMSRQAAGYLTSGGTTANVYGLWVARNLRSWPFSLRLAMQSASPRGKTIDAPMERAVKDALSTLEVNAGRDGMVRFLNLSAWNLFNLPMPTVYRLRTTVFEHVRRALPDRFHGDDGATQARRFVEEWVSPYTIQEMGAVEYSRQLSDLPSLRGEAALFAKAWSVIVARNKHYSWIKGLDLLGIGHRSLLEVEHGRDFTMNVDHLSDILLKASTDHHPVLAVASVFGSTEEGALDDLPAIRNALSTAGEGGLHSWLHVDACYGGYLGSLIRQTPGTVPVDGTQIAEFVHSVGMECGLAESVSRRYVDLSNRPGWLDWDDLGARIAGMALADSISLDPHKLGYVPYPAGAVLLADFEAREVVSYDAPYLWVGTNRPSSSFVGRYTLEGSRAGAVAASAWLAHTAVPLSQEGHGKLLAASILAVRELHQALESAFEPAAQDADHVGLSFFNQPHLNMLCYVPFHRQSKDLEEIADVARRLADHFGPTRQGDFMIVKTGVVLPLTRASLENHFGADLGGRLFDQERKSATPRSECHFDVLRSVVMGPLSLNARRRPDDALLFGLFANDLLNQTRALFEESRRDRLRRAYKGQTCMLAMDDRPEILDLLKAAVEPDAELRTSGTLEEFKRLLAAQGAPVRHVFLDIDMGQGGEGAGFDALTCVCERNDNVEDGFRVDLVVFLTVGAVDLKTRARSITSKFLHPPAWTVHHKPAPGQNMNEFAGSVWKTLHVYEPASKAR